MEQEINMNKDAEAFFEEPSDIDKAAAEYQKYNNGGISKDIFKAGALWLLDQAKKRRFDVAVPSNRYPSVIDILILEVLCGEKK